MIRKLTEDECALAMKAGDFAPDLVGGPCTAVILTQSWCPQWKAVKAYLPQAEEKLPGLKVFYVEYDIEEWKSLSNEEFMTFKENAYDNREIPYIRYYTDGVFRRDSNYIALQGFLERFGQL